MVLLHQENGPAHMAVMTAMLDYGFELVNHPPYSPDLGMIATTCRNIFMMKLQPSFCQLTRLFWLDFFCNCLCEVAVSKYWITVQMWRYLICLVLLTPSCQPTKIFQLPLIGVDASTGCTIYKQQNHQQSILVHTLCSLFLCPFTTEMTFDVSDSSAQ